MSARMLTDTTNSRVPFRQQLVSQTMQKATDFSREFDLEDRQTRREALPKETDPHKLAQRQKQIDFGKNTLGYAAYIKAVPRHRRSEGDPVTPDRTFECSKRTFDGMVKKWRRDLHKWDPQEGEVAQPLIASLPPPPPGRLPPPSAANAELLLPSLQVATGSGGKRTAGAAAGSGAHSSGGGAGSKRRLDDSTEDDTNGLQSKLQRFGDERSRDAAPAAQLLDDPTDDPDPDVDPVAAAAEADIYGDWDDDEIQI